MFSKSEEKRLRAFAREKLGLAKNATIKQIINNLNSKQVNEKNFYKQMDKYKTYLEDEERFKLFQQEQEKKHKMIVEKEKIKKEKANIKAKEKRQETKIIKVEEFKKRLIHTFRPGDYTIENAILYGHKSINGYIMSEFRKLLKNLIGLNVLFKISYTGILRDIHGDGYESNRTIADNQSFSKWWDDIGIWILLRNSDEFLWDHPDQPDENLNKSSPKDVIIQILQPERVTEIKTKKQKFKEGSVNCLMKPIQEWAIDCLKKAVSKSAKSRYKTRIEKIEKLLLEIGNDGVDEDKIHEITSTLDIDISIESPFFNRVENDHVYIVESKTNKKALKHFRYRNTKIDHVELNEFTNLNNIEEVSYPELLNIKKGLDLNHIYYNYTKPRDIIKTISTLDKTYITKTKFSEQKKDFEAETGLNHCYIDYIDDKGLSQFIISGCHFNGTIDFKDIFDYRFKVELNHHDMEKAYMNYLHCSFYKGFLGKITDFRKCDKIEGVGMYRIKDLKYNNDKFEQLNKTMNVYHNDYTYTSVELEFLTSMGCTYKIVCGCWGVEPLHIDLFDYPFMLEEHNDVKNYARYVGMCSSINKMNRYWFNGDMELVNAIKQIDGAIIDTYSNNEICLSYPKNHVWHLSHFSAFITAYQRIQVLEQLMNMNLDNVVRVCVDGIYYVGEEEFKYPFVDKKHKIKLGNSGGERYISTYAPCEEEYLFAKRREHNHKELHIGPGGNGKTHYNLLDYGLVRPLYIATSYLLTSDKDKEYESKSKVIANVITDDVDKQNKIKKFYNVLIVDECSMMTEQQKQFIFDTYHEMKIIFCGDVGYQAPPFSKLGPVQEMGLDGFDKVIEYTVNYRFKCDKLKELIRLVRLMIQYNEPDIVVNKLVYDTCYKVNNFDVLKKYDINDIILTRSKEQRKPYAEMFSHLNKWHIKENTRQYKNGQIVIGDKPPVSCELQHAFTIHGIQGKTCDNKIFINMDTIYEKRVLYTAISRARTLNQIFIVKN